MVTQTFLPARSESLVVWTSLACCSSSLARIIGRGVLRSAPLNFLSSRHFSYLYFVAATQVFLIIGCHYPRQYSDFLIYLWFMDIKNLKFPGINLHFEWIRKWPCFLVDELFPWTLGPSNSPSLRYWGQKARMLQVRCAGVRHIPTSYGQSSNLSGFYLLAYTLAEPSLGHSIILSG